MKSSHGTVPAGLTLYLFDYPEGHVSDGTWCSGPGGECVPNPPQCFLEGDEQAMKFGAEFGANRATNAVTGKVISL